MGWIIDKRTALGFVTAICIIIVSLLLCAFFLIRSILPENSATIWIWVSFGLAVLFGGRIASKGQGRQPCALIPALLVYVLVWLLALSCKEEIIFSSCGIGSTVALVSGALLAFISTGAKKKKGVYKRKRLTVHSVKW